MAKKEKRDKDEEKRKRRKTEKNGGQHTEETDPVKSIADLFGSSSTDPALAALFKPDAAPLKPVKRTKVMAALPREHTASDREDSAPAVPQVEDSQDTIPAHGENSLKASKKRKRKEKSDQADIEDIENRYLKKVYSKVLNQESPVTNALPESTDLVVPTNPGDIANEEEDIDPELLQHETLTPQSTAADKTIFISNLPVKVLISKPRLRELKQLFSAHGNILSIRFRSIAFSELGPRKVAFITKKLHPERDTLNAYVVYETADSVSKAVKALNGFIWEGKHLRVDSVANPAPHDHRRSVFVGNLPFDVQDEQLYVHFSRCGDIEFVRVIRDKKTNIGKGFGYVQFKDRDSIDKAVLLNDKPAAGLKRQLRVTYAKKEGTTKEIKGNFAAAQVRLQRKHKKEVGDRIAKQALEGKRAKKTKSGGSGFKVGKKRGKMRLVETKS